jgi:hypothetical protein
VGNGADYAAQVSGLIAKATGSFADVSPGITEQGQFDGSGPQVANTYSLQLNTNFFSSSPACSGISGCLAWQQFVYDSSNNAIYMQYWLIYYLTGTNACPSGWITYATISSCFVNSNAVFVSPTITAAELATTTLSGSAMPGGSDTLTLTAGTQAFAVSNADSQVSLATAWNQTEWGVFGDGGGGAANFGANTTLEPETTIVSNSPAAPTCTANAGTTGETNNLTLSTTPALGSSTSGMIGSLQTNANPGTASCASVAPTNIPSTTVVSGASEAYPVSNQYTATVTPTYPPSLYPPVAGTVSFSNGGSAINGCQNLAVGTGGKAVCTADLAIGSHSIAAAYSGDTNYLTSTSPPFDQTIVGYPTTTVVSATARGSSSSTESIGATVTSPYASATNPLGAGTVSFEVNGSALSGCQSIAVSGVTSAVATCVGTLPAGSDSVTATYSGNGAFAGSTSTGVIQSVTGVALTSSQDPASPVTKVTYTATVTETDGGGSVSFRVGGKSIAGCQARSLSASDTATCTTAPGAMGSHSITAAYSGDTAIPAATSPALSEQVFGVSGASAPPALSQSPFTVTFDEPVTGVSAANFTVNETGFTTGLVGTVSCTNASNASVNCATGAVSQASLTPTKPLIAGEHYLIGVNSAAGGIKTTGGAPVPATVVFVRADTQVSFSQYPVTYTWASVKRAAALGGSFVQEESPGGSETFSATGTSVGIVTWDAPDGGTATVTVTNGTTRVTRTIDTYAASPGDQTSTISGLNNIAHSVTIRVKGAHDASSTGDWVRIDGTIVGGVTQDTPGLTAAWPVLGTTDAYTRVKGASVSLEFRGTGAVWTAYTGPAEGKASVSIDGGTPVTEDLYASSDGPRSITFGGLPQSGFHTIRITALGTADAAAGNAFTTVESFTVQ